MSRTKVFVSYSHLDREWLEMVMSHLAVLERQGLVDTWTDTRIRAGTAWRPAIDAELKSCQVAILLVSANFLSSEFINEVEVKTLLERHESGGLELLPLIVRPCAWRLVDWLAARQCRPRDGRALSMGTQPEVDRDLAALTYEIGMLLGRAGPLAIDEMTLLSAPWKRGASPAYAEPWSGPIEVLPALDGRVWQGQYGPASGDMRARMRLLIESADRLGFRGRCDWDDSGTTVIEGRWDVASVILEDEGTWRRVAEVAGPPRYCLRFTDVEQTRGSGLALHGDYRAILQDDGTLVGLWYGGRGDAGPIGQFVLRPAAARVA